MVRYRISVFSSIHSFSLFETRQGHFLRVQNDEYVFGRICSGVARHVVDKLIERYRMIGFIDNPGPVEVREIRFVVGDQFVDLFLRMKDKGLRSRH